MTRDLRDYQGITEVVPLAIPTLRKYVSSGMIPHIKIGSRVFFDVEEIEQWIG